uniref:Short-chain dehydrogenase/reductase 3 n=1 Tax=Macrostomum lignano TaxID=282301 RepID=A0A1I8GNA6_9PLAT
MHAIVDVLFFLVRLPCWFAISWVQFFYRCVVPKRKSIRGQVAMVTGAGAGIGQLICVRLARLGCRVAAWDISSEGLEATRRLVAEACGSSGSAQFESFICDVASREACYSVAKETLNRMGRVDIVVNNAGIVQGKTLLDSDDDKTEKLYRVNLLSHYWITKALLPHMLSRGSGHLFYTASCTAWMGASRLTDYTASKAADLIFTESLQSELRSCYPNARIPVTTLCPYLIRTGMFQGCNSPIEWLFPSLDPAYVADRAVAAILAEESVVALPRFVYIFVALKAILPNPAYEAMQHLGNIDRFMAPFVGSVSAAIKSKANSISHSPNSSSISTSYINPSFTAMHPIVDVLLFLVRLPCWFAISWVQFFYRCVVPKCKSIRGQVAMITGAGAGIGQLICVRLARLGCRVAAWDISSEGLEATRRLVAEACGSSGSAQFESFICDVASREACYSVAKETLNRMGRVDIVVNNAGIVQGKTLLDSDDDKTEKLYRVNLLSHYWITKALLPHMLSRGSGHLFYTASCAGWIGASHLSDYCASKAADVIFAESLQSELRSCYPNARIPVTTLCPYLIRTGMFQGCNSPIEWLFPSLDPAYVADRAVAAILAEESLVAVPRIVYCFIALKTVLPNPAYEALQKLGNVDQFMLPFRGSLPSAQTRTAAPIVVVVGNGKENLDGVSKLRQLKNQQLNLMQNQSDKSVFLNGTATPEHSSSNVGASLNIGSRHIASSINVLGNQQQQGCLLQLSLPPQGNVSSRAQRSHLDQHQQSMTWFYRPEESLLGSQLNLALQQQQKHNRTANSDVDLNCNHFNDGLVANEDREHPLARPPPPPPPPPVQSRIVVKLSFPPAEVAAIDRQIQSIEEPYSPQSHLFICQSFLRPPKPFNAFANFIDWFPSAEDFPDFVSAHRQQLVEGPDCLISLTRLLIMLDLERHLLALLQSRLLHPRVRMPGPSRFTLLHTACLADSVQCVTLLHKLDSSNCVKLLDASGRSLSAVASPTVRSKVRLSTSSVGSAATSMAVKAPLSLFKFLTPSSNQQKQKAEFNSGPVSLTPEQRIHALGLVTNPATHEELLVLANQGQLNISAVNGGDNALLHRCLEMGLSSLALLANLLRRKLLLTDSSSINRNNQSESPLSHQLIHLSQGWDSEYRQHYLACYLHLLKADLNAADSSLGRTALHLAALAADEDLTNFLLQHEVDFNLPDKAGALPDHLGFKCSGGNNPCTRLIERRRNQRSRVIAELVSRLPDQLAARFRHTDLFVTDPDGFTPLCLAAKCNSMSALQFLLDQPDCPINGQHPATGRTALAMAAAEDNALAVRLLLEYGACPAVRDFEHRLALELAVSAGNAASVQAMLAYTACL